MPFYLFEYEGGEGLYLPVNQHNHESLSNILHKYKQNVYP